MLICNTCYVYSAIKSPSPSATGAGVLVYTDKYCSFESFDGETDVSRDLMIATTGECRGSAFVPAGRLVLCNHIRRRAEKQIIESVVSDTEACYDVLLGASNIEQTAP